MHVLDALFDHIQQMSSNAEILAFFAQFSALDVRVGVKNRNGAKPRLSSALTSETDVM
jgi:hypothetical protein